MPFSYAQYAGDGTTTTFSVPFPYLLKPHVKVYLGYNILDDSHETELVVGTDYDWVTDTQIAVTVPPPADETLTFIRRTPNSALMVDWEDASNLVADDLETADLQLLYISQESNDRTFFALEAGKVLQFDERPATYYVRSDGDNANEGRNPANAYKNIEHALSVVAELPQASPATIVMLDGAEVDGELDVPDFTTVLGVNFQRRTIIKPVPGNEQRNVFRCGNGVHLVNLKFTGWQIDDFDNPTKGFAMVFRPGATILPGGVPYGQNCVVTAAMTEVPTPLPMDPEAGNPAQPKGGGCVLADASVLSAYTVFPNIMSWGFTPSSHNGLGYVARNRGFVNPVNAIGVGAHRHFMCLDGGQMVVSGSSSQFGDYSFWSEGSTQQVVPLKVPAGTLSKDPTMGALIQALKPLVVDDVWAFLLAGYSAASWPATFEALTYKDTGLLIDALASSITHGFERPMLNFAEGMFKFTGECVYTYVYHDAFKASWDRVATVLAGSGLSSAAETMVTALIARLKATMDNYWFELSLGPAPTPVEPVRRRLRSLITAINHQWTAPLAGVEFYRVPPARAARQIKRSIVQRGGGRVRFSGQDDAGNAVFVGGLVVDARSGQLGGRPFDSAIRGRVTRAVLARSY